MDGVRTSELEEVGYHPVKVDDYLFQETLWIVLCDLRVLLCPTPPFRDRHCRELLSVRDGDPGVYGE